jgi:hypothetical protein
MFISHWALPLVVVVLVAFAGASLFATWEAPAQSFQAHSTAFGPASSGGESNVPSSTSMLAASENYEFDGVLGSVLDGENDDESSGSPEVLGMLSSLVLLLLGSKPLLACYEETEKLSSVCCLALDRPG